MGNQAFVGPRLGEWAVVTGGTDGIGKSYAEELAKRGMKIVLISRSQDKLKEVSNNIKENSTLKQGPLLSTFHWMIFMIKLRQACLVLKLAF